MENLKYMSILISIVILPNFSKLNSFNHEDMKRLLGGEINLVGANFSGADLSGKNLEHRNFTQANFENAILNGTKFNNSNLRRANLSNVQAIGANFVGCVMRKTNFLNANFTRSKFGNREIHNWDCADIRGAILLNTNFYGANLDKVDLRNVVVNEYTNFSNSSMFLVKVNREIFDIVKHENIFLIEKPDDSVLEGLITDVRQLRLEQIQPIEPTNDPEKLFETPECQICLETFTKNTEIAMLPCGHTFHIECITEWFSRKYECPLCRFRTNWYKQIILGA